MEIKDFPKIDLHCHLDGSLSPAWIASALDIPCDDALREKLQAPVRCASLAEYLTRFDLPLSALTTAERFASAVEDVLAQAAAEHIVYTEIRFAPMLSVREDLRVEAIAEGAIEGLRRGTEAYDIKAGLIFCAMRHMSEKENLAVLELTRRYLGQGVVGFDIAGDEAAFGNERFADLFKKARAYDIPFTIHSGECGSAKNVRLAIEYGARRIGHGIAMIKDPRLMELAAKKEIGIEMCPTSNYQTGAVKDGDVYPLRQFLDAGICVSINTDNRTVSDTDMTRELKFCRERLGLKDEEVALIYQNSVEMAFAV